MGFFDGFINKSELSELELELKSYEKIVKELKNNDKINDSLKESILNYISSKIIIDGVLNETQISSEDFIFILGLYENVKLDFTFDRYIELVSKVYDKVIIDKNNKSQKQYFYKILRIAAKRDLDFLGLIVDDYNCVFDMFEKKELFLSFLDNVPTDMSIPFREKYIDYIFRTRRFYVDEIQFLTRIITVAKNFYNKKFDVDVINSLFLEDRRNAGIYDVSMEDIERIEKCIRDIKIELSLFNKAKEEELEQINKGISVLEGGYKAKIENKFSLLDASIEKYSSDVGNLKSDIEGYSDEKKKDIDKYFDSLVQTIDGLKKELDMITLNLVHGQAVKLTEDYQNCVSLINEIMNGTSTDDNIQNKIIQLGEILLRIVSTINDKSDSIKNNGVNEGEVVSKSTELNKYLDPSKSLRERLDAVLSNKKSDEIYHKSVDKVVKELLHSNTVYLVGPSGCCKTYSVKQIANLLELPLYDFGFVTDEHETFKSYKDVHGNFVKNVFYEAYKNGGICFFDEIDNSESKALVELNRIIGGNGEYEAYLFPNGELVHPHPNLRIVVAGNTYGDGASEAYSTRERLDFGTIDRFQAVEYYYDTELEKKVLENYPDVYQFSMAYRDALTNIGYEYTLTTRRIFKIKKNLDSGCYSVEEIVYDFFISSLRIDVLENIKSYIGSKVSNNNKYYNTFVSLVNNKKNNSYTRKRGL